MQNYLIKPIGVVRSDYREASLTLQEQDLELDEEILTIVLSKRKFPFHRKVSCGVRG